MNKYIFMEFMILKIDAKFLKVDYTKIGIKIFVPYKFTIAFLIQFLWFTFSSVFLNNMMNLHFYICRCHKKCKQY